MDAIEKIDYKGYEIQIYQDESPMSPEDWEDGDCFVVFKDSRNNKKYDLSFDYTQAQLEALDVLKDGIGNGYYKKLIEDGKYSDLVRELDHIQSDILEDDDKFYYPIQVYRDYISVQNRNSYCDADNGCIVIDKRNFEEGLELEDLLKKCDELAKSIAKSWNQYLSGKVYGYQVIKKVRCEHCGEVNEDCIDSCWGFYGWEYMKEHIESEVKTMIDDIVEKESNREAKSNE